MTHKNLVDFKFVIQTRRNSNALLFLLYFIVCDSLSFSHVRLYLHTNTLTFEFGHKNHLRITILWLIFTCVQRIAHTHTAHQSTCTEVYMTKQKTKFKNLHWVRSYLVFIGVFVWIRKLKSMYKNHNDRTWWMSYAAYIFITFVSIGLLIAFYEKQFFGESTPDVKLTTNKAELISKVKILWFSYWGPNAPSHSELRLQICNERSKSNCEFFSPYDKNSFVWFIVKIFYSWFM